jgi:hypothetical protein
MSLAPGEIDLRAHNPEVADRIRSAMKPGGPGGGSAWSSLGQVAMAKDGSQWRSPRFGNGVT